MDPSISLVVGSVGRTTALRRLLTSLTAQTFKDFEVIIVEQRDPVATRTLAADFPDLAVSVLDSSPGLSRARNAGLAAVSGGIIGFPDDDCWYHSTTLMTVAEEFAKSPASGLVCGRVETSSGPMLRYPREGARLTPENIWTTVVSPGMFVSRTVAANSGGFDVGLGVGAGTPYGSGEETDFALRILDAGHPAQFVPHIRIRHPAPAEVGGRLSPKLGLSYGRGLGGVMRRHGVPLSAALSKFFRPLVGAGVAAVRRDIPLAMFRLAVVRGRLSGYVKPPLPRTGEKHVREGTTANGNHRS